MSFCIDLREKAKGLFDARVSFANSPDDNTEDMVEVNNAKNMLNAVEFAVSMNVVRKYLIINKIHKYTLNINYIMLFFPPFSRFDK